MNAMHFLRFAEGISMGRRMAMWVALLSFLPQAAWAVTAGGPPGNMNMAAPSASGLEFNISSLRFSNYSADELTKKRAVLVCYILRASSDPTKAFLEPAGFQREAFTDANGDPINCWDRSSVPIVNGRKLIIGIFAPQWNNVEVPAPLNSGNSVQDAARQAEISYANALNNRAIIVSVTYNSASPINPTPIRPSFGAPTGTQAVVKAPSAPPPPMPKGPTGMHYIEWPNDTVGDSIPVVSISYAGPPSPGQTDAQIYPVLNDSLPQVHSLSRFNLSMGVIYSTVRSKSFAFSNATPSTPIIASRNPIIDPVLFFTYYPVPIDAERDWQPSDIIPGISFGLSLSSPTSNFYLGGMSEFPFVRNVQIVYGVTAAKTTELAPRNTFLPTPSGSNSPPTVQRFTTGAYVGLSFNITGFINTLFKAGGGG